MKVATWNVNSIRTRLERVTAWLRREAPDVLCLQELKVVDDDLPRTELEALGYHVEAWGQKTYNGVAILSRRPPTDVVRGIPEDGADAEARAIAATVDGVRVVCVYIPNGQRVTSEKFAYKLDWLDRLREGLAGTLADHRKVLVAGDFNIAPDDRDVHDPDAWRGQVHFHPKEHEALGRILALGLEDVFRRHHEEGGHYSWWDYRGGSFPRNEGLRIDLLLAGGALAGRSAEASIDAGERREDAGAGKPSDHAPVTAIFRA